MSFKSGICEAHMVSVMSGIYKHFKRENTQEQVAKHTFITPLNIEPIQCIQSHRSKQRAGVEETGCISIVAFGEERRRME